MNTKEKVLQKCAELHNPSAPWINDNWELDKMRSKARYSLTKYNNGSLAKYVFDESVPENDLVWPLAAQVLGVGEPRTNGVKESMMRRVVDFFGQNRGNEMKPHEIADKMELAAYADRVNLYGCLCRLTKMAIIDRRKRNGREYVYFKPNEV